MGSEGSANIDLLPRALGPNSILPCIQPIAFPASIASAVLDTKTSSFNSLKTALKNLSSHTTRNNERQVVRNVAFGKGIKVQVLIDKNIIRNNKPTGNDLGEISKTSRGIGNLTRIVDRSTESARLIGDVDGKMG